MLEVLLSCCKNPDIPGGYWSEGKRPRPMWVKVANPAEARERGAPVELGGRAAEAARAVALHRALDDSQHPGWPGCD